MRACTILDFDTQLFGYPVARIDARDFSVASLRQTIAELKAEDVRLAYLAVVPEDPGNTIAVNCGGQKVDSKAVYEKEISGGGALVESPRIVSYPGGVSSEPLLSLAYQSGTYSRFRTDPHFTGGEFEKLYALWIEKSVKREIADEVLIYTSNKTPVGLMTYSLEKDKSTIGLFSIDEKFRGQSIGRDLILHGIAAIGRSGAKRVSVATQLDNSAACNFYSKHGFVLKTVHNVYHFWL